MIFLNEDLYNYINHFISFFIKLNLFEYPSRIIEYLSLCMLSGSRGVLGILKNRLTAIKSRRIVSSNDTKLAEIQNNPTL